MKYENPLFDPDISDDTPVTVLQAVEYLHVSKSQMYALVKSGKLPYVKGISRHLLFKVKDVKALVEQLRVVPTNPEFPNSKNQPTPA